MPDLLPPGVRALILDMDGVLWTGDHPIGDLSEIFNAITKMDLRVVLATNNSTRTPSQYLNRLRGYGLNLEPWQIITSSLALANLLRKNFSAGSEVFTIGEAGLLEALSQAGFTPIVDVDYPGDSVAVALGMDRAISFLKLRCATLLIRKGIPFYATNPDRTFPTAEGLIPGAGSIIAALVASTDEEPIIAGKPAPALFELALERLGVKPEEALVVGDRIETDIVGGQMVGCHTALVLSGVTTQEMLSSQETAADIVAPDLATLFSGE